jgi:hypothetical protein
MKRTKWNPPIITSDKMCWKADDLGLFRKWLILPIQQGQMIKPARQLMHLSTQRGQSHLTMKMNSIQRSDLTCPGQCPMPNHTHAMQSQHQTLRRSLG